MRATTESTHPALRRERQTRQLEATYAAVRDAHDHPTAEQVHARVRRRIKTISLGTVYRNLQKLIAQGHIRHVQVGAGSTRFDRMVDPHEHFVCEACGDIADLAASTPEHAHVSALRRAGYRVTRQAVTLFGTCPRCSAKRGHP
ncbi:MAG TPA: transcriptional repressor [Candidatus Binatia bacterium]|nr:transcriptional repressor [Candidatus Binatia bacterium]